MTGGKFRLSQAVASRELDQASLNLLVERYAVIGSVRAAFYEVYALEQRREILLELVKLSEQAVSQARTAVENKQMARIDLVPLEVELERFRADVDSLERELPSARGRLAALAGDPRLRVARLTGPFGLPPEYDYEQAREVVMASHPEVRSARVGVDRAQAALRRAEVEPIPNVSVSTGYVRQSQNKSNDWMLGVSAPFPLWNRRTRATLGGPVPTSVVTC